MRTIALIRLLHASLLATAATGLFAQTAAESKSAAAPADSEILTLDSFVVTSSKAEGYRATNAITATGIGTKIADTPLAISVVTGELMQDAGQFEMREALNFVPGVLTNPRSESAVTIRGFGGLISYRNGQYRRQLMTTWNMDRIEVIKGPAAIFFGAVRPGGIVNNVTAKPEFSGNFTDVKVTAGTESHYQGEFFTNQVLSDKLAVRVGAGMIDAGGERPFDYKDEIYFGASAIWKPTANQQFSFDVETIDRQVFYNSAYPFRALANSKVYGVAGAIAAQAGINRQTTTADSTNRAYLTTLGFSGTVGAANFYPLYDMFAPYGYQTTLARDAWQVQRSETVDLDYLLKINENLVWQTSLNYGFDNTSGLQPSDGDVRPYADGSLRFRTESFINVRDSYNVDNKLTWRFDLGKTKHTVQFGQEYQRVIFTRPGFYNDASATVKTYNDSPGNSTKTGVPNQYVTYYFPGGSTPASVESVFAASGQTFSITRKRTENNAGYFIVDQAQFFDDRLYVLAGARYNKFTGKITYDKPVSNSSQSAANGGLATFDVIGAKGAWTPQYGALFKVTPALALFTTYSESIEPNFQLDADGVPSLPVESQSLDFGLKADLLAGRLTSTIAYYDIERDNLAYRDTARELAAGRSPYYIFGNAEASKGLEFELNWTPTDNYSLIFGWANSIEAETTKSNNATFIGRRFGGIPENTYNVWNRYSFTDGPLAGLTLAGGVRHNDGTNLSQDPNNIVQIPAFTVFDVMASYKFKAGDRTYKAQLNVKNLTDKLYREGSDGYFGQKRTIYLSLSTRF
ncbi:TonB-dependent receptor [Oleiharenicola lentus]|uniref:TonB-dependent receptor n=1 Tax=Oleiharenicola lentus TaxID=2508720 RepID=A0A4Q1C5Q4_9BACT|nr:TonB-dependent receptor [Oleiharenicola lentus]RXK53782.1 TonB-dependent receptor [Oleiharenicola lentus]